MKCEQCQFCDSSECRRYPPTDRGFPRVSSVSWCGEFKEVVKVEVFESPPSQPPPPPEPEKRKPGWPKGVPRKVAV